MRVHCTMVLDERRVIAELEFFARDCSETRA